VTTYCNYEVISKRRITVTSSLNEISTDQLGTRVRPPLMHPFLQRAAAWICKDDVNGFSFTSDSCFTVVGGHDGKTEEENNGYVVCNC
jgi:hypothetical protein